MSYTREELEAIASIVSKRPGGWLRHFMQAYLEADSDGKVVLEPALYWFIHKYELHELYEQ